MKKYYVKRMVCLSLIIALLMTGLPYKVCATGRTADEAIAWAQSMVGKSIDVDGYYGAQCVDLIMAYYDYLEGYHVSGNGCDYATNALPSGWQRIPNARPQKGDILVYTGTSANPYGHVAIYESDYVHYDQNVNNVQKVFRMTSHYSEGFGYNIYWGVIRPNFSSVSQNTTVTWSQSGKENISTTSASATLACKATIQGGYVDSTSKAGIALADVYGNVVASKEERAYPNSGTNNVVEMWYDVAGELGYSLSPGAAYYYQFYLIVNGKTYVSDLFGFVAGGKQVFTDVDPKSFCAFPVSWAVAYGVTSGKTASTFVPNGACTRAEVVTFLWRAYGCPTPAGNRSPFVDVKDGKYYTNAVLWAVENGITNGTDATHFSPNATVTRAQFVTFLYRVMGEPAVTGSNSFSDVKAGQYYTNPIIWASEKKITNGINDTQFGTGNPCTRGQVVTFLFRAF